MKFIARTARNRTAFEGQAAEHQPRRDKWSGGRIWRSLPPKNADTLRRLIRSRWQTTKRSICRKVTASFYFPGRQLEATVHNELAFENLEDVLAKCRTAARLAVQDTISANFPFGIQEIEGLYDAIGIADISKSGATLEFKVTVYLTPLETPVDVQIGAALDDALASFDHGKPERPQTELSQRLNRILDAVFEQLGPPYSHTPAWDEYPERCLLVFGVQKTDADGHWAMGSSISHRDFVAKTDAEWIEDYVAYIPTLFEERTGPQYLRDDSEDDCI